MRQNECVWGAGNVRLQHTPAAICFCLERKERQADFWRLTLRLWRRVLQFVFEATLSLLMTSSDGDNWEEDWIHISKAIWLPSSRDGSTVAPGKCSQVEKNSTKKRRHSSEDWLSLRIDGAVQSIMLHRFSFQGPEPYSFLYHPCHKEILRGPQAAKSVFHQWTCTTGSFWNGNLVHFSVLHN